MKFMTLEDHALDDGTTLTCERVGLIKDGDSVLIDRHFPLKITWPSGDKQTLKVWDKTELRIVNRKLSVERVEHVVPGLTKEQGMAAAYEAQAEDRGNYENLLYRLCLTTPPSQILSANEVWAYWRNLKWPEAEKRGFVGPTMTAATKAGWTKFVKKVESTTGNGHSGVLIGGYSSLIYRGD